MDILPAGGRAGGSRTAGGVDIPLMIPEHGRTVHCNQEHYGPLSGVERRPGSRISKRWWYLVRLDVKGRWTAAWEAERM